MSNRPESLIALRQLNEMLEAEVSSEICLVRSGASSSASRRLCKLASVFFPAADCAGGVTSEDDATDATSSEAERTAVSPIFPSKGAHECREDILTIG